MQRDPGADPNLVWTSLTRDFLGIAPHPELSWWAMRGQLVEAPGYMTNYAIGAILAADLRARCAEERGPFWAGGRKYYAWLSEELYRFGLERPSRDVLRAFLGRASSPGALLEDLERMRPRR
jgi:Zn-dependent M32 family carboxypeptidase